jgi:hypothetical protein
LKVADGEGIRAPNGPPALFLHRFYRFDLGQFLASAAEIGDYGNQDLFKNQAKVVGTEIARTGMVP